jgi:sulfur-carrier protein
MNVDVALFASLSQFQPDGLGGTRARSFDLTEGTTIAQVIDSLGLPEQPRVVFVNSRHADEDSALQEGDRLAIFPPVAGG